MVPVDWRSKKERWRRKGDEVVVAILSVLWLSCACFLVDLYTSRRMSFCCRRVVMARKEVQRVGNPLVYCNTNYKCRVIFFAFALSL